MPSTEFCYWQAMEVLEPCGPLMDDFRAGSICATVYNMARDPKAQSLGAADFMPGLRAEMRGDPEPEKPAPNLTPEQEAAFLDASFGFR